MLCYRAMSEVPAPTAPELYPLMFHLIRHLGAKCFLLTLSKWAGKNSKWSLYSVVSMDNIWRAVSIGRNCALSVMWIATPPQVCFACFVVSATGAGVKTTGRNRTPEKLAIIQLFCPLFAVTPRRTNVFKRLCRSASLTHVCSFKEA